MKDRKRIRLPMPQLSEGSKDGIDYLQKLAMEGVRCYLAHNEPYCEETLRRVKSELEVVAKGYPEYFIIINELVHWARRNGIPVNVNRGSVCASCLAYLLDLTTENPLLKHLRFEKFINPMFAEGWLPDIDLEVPESGIPAIHAHMVDVYGNDHFAKIKNYPRGFVLCSDNITDIGPTETGDDGLMSITAPVSDVLKAGLCKFDLDIAERHPIEMECLRETNGLTVYHEQITDMINLMSRRSYAWSTWAEKCLAIARAQDNERNHNDFVAGCLANPMFRQRKWKDERVAREYAESLWNNWSRSATHLFMRTHALCGDKTVRYATNRIAIGDVAMQDVGIALKRGDRVAIIVRHAERPPLEKNDPTFGKELRLTEHGREQAKAFGFVLSQFTENASRYITTGENLRCDETARLIAKELGAPVSARYVYGENMLGSGSPFFGNVHERMALAEQGDYRESLNEYFRTGVQRGFKDLCAATDILEDFVWSDRWATHNEQLQVFVTHDINVACFLAGRGVVTRFEEYNWPGYLDAAVAFISHNGQARYGYMRTMENRMRIDL